MESELCKRPKNTWKIDQAQAYQTMEQELKSLQPFSLVIRLNALLGLRHTKESTRPTIDICQITANAFHLNLKKKDNELFTTSLYEIDWLLRER
jgi:uncharacterized protein YutE (UPF0331/DUF86 family)